MAALTNLRTSLRLVARRKAVFMNSKDFLRLGVPLGEATRRATDFVAQYVLRGGDTSKLEHEIRAIVANPNAFFEDPLRKDFAKAIANSPPTPRAVPVRYRQWGDGLDHEAVMQMEKACLLPVSVAGVVELYRKYGDGGKNAEQNKAD